MLIHLELVFVQGDRYESISILLSMDPQFSQNHLFKILRFLQLYLWNHTQILNGYNFLHSYLGYIVPLYFVPLIDVIVRVSIAVKRHHDHNNSYKGKPLIGVAYSFRGSVHYHHNGTWW